MDCHPSPLFPTFSFIKNFYPTETIKHLIDKEKLITLAYKSKEKALKYRDQLLEILRDKRGKQSRLYQVLERLKLIPDSEEAIKKVNEQTLSLTEEIDDCYDTIRILNNWKY